jgi:hypothetical protein
MSNNKQAEAARTNQDDQLTDRDLNDVSGGGIWFVLGAMVLWEVGGEIVSAVSKKF